MDSFRAFISLIGRIDMLNNEIKIPVIRHEESGLKPGLGVNRIISDLVQKRRIILSFVYKIIFAIFEQEP